ncbi:glycosyltransferase [Flavobacteriaceae bacterium Ap0902]|nr:glycosyltransferase [Flavobacteriaceae bacterium Ap0902]
MKILQVINSLNTGGAEKLILDTLPKYEEKGMDIDLAVLVDHDYPFLKSLKEDFKGQIFILGSGSVYNPKTILPLARLMKNYDLVHVHLFPAQYYALVANKINKNKAQLLFTEHCTFNRRMESRLFKPLEKLVYNGYDKTICITPEIQDILKNHVNAKEHQLPVIHNGIDLQKIYTAKPLEKNTIDDKIHIDDKLIIQVAAFRLQKDQPTAIRAMQHLPENFKLILVGDGEQRENCEQLAEDLGLTHNVIFLGKRNDVPRLLKSTDYVVLSSHFEGLSLSSIEGMASGKPFIASDVPGLTEIVKGYGLLFPDKDEKALADIILQLENDPVLYQETVKKCQLRASEFDIEKMINQHIELYEGLTS